MVNDTCQQQREHALICHDTRKWNYSERQQCSAGAVVLPGSPGHTDSDSTSLWMQQRWKWASISNPYRPPPTCTLSKSLDVLRCWDSLIGKENIHPLKKILASDKGIFNSLQSRHIAPPCVFFNTQIKGKSRRRIEDTQALKPVSRMLGKIIKTKSPHS